MTMTREPSRFWRAVLVGAAVVALAATGCKAARGDPGPAGQNGTNGTVDDQDGADGRDGWQGTPSVLTKYDTLPGVVLTIAKVEGATGADGTFQVGDQPVVTFTIAKKDGKRLFIEEMNSASIIFDGPVSHHRTVIGAVSSTTGAITGGLTDVLANTVENADGSYTYTFSKPIPATYPAQLNDSDVLGADDGELKGQALLPGSYTVGLQAHRTYIIDGVNHRDAGNVVFEVRVLGGAAESREVTTNANCNRGVPRYAVPGLVREG